MHSVENKKQWKLQQNTLHKGCRPITVGRQHFYKQTMRIFIYTLCDDLTLSTNLSIGTEKVWGKYMY